MSTDTMYFNSSRLMPASSKNNKNSVTRLDKKRIQAERKNKVRQETMDVSLPEPQILPNGEKPDFGNSKSRRKPGQVSTSTGKQKNSSAAINEARKDNSSFNTAEVAQNLKDMYLKSENDKPRSNNIRRKKDKKQNSLISQGNTTDLRSESVKSDRSASKSSSQTPVSTPLMKPVSQPVNETSPATLSPMQYPNNHVASPSFLNPGLSLGLPPTRPPSSPASQMQFQQQQPQQAAYAGYPYGNYSLISPFNAPHFMAPQTPLMNPMYPQPPLQQLPVMYKALDMQQRQMELQYYQNAAHAPKQQMPHQQQHYDRPASAPFGTTEIPKVAECSTIVGRSKPRENQAQRNSTSFAGGSFSSKDPKINKLPKPSFA